MISKKYSSMLNNTSIIREFAQYASKRAAEIGAENVFNYTIGNPSVPTTDDFNKGLIDLIQNEDSLALHGYSPTIFGDTDPSDYPDGTLPSGGSIIKAGE